MNEKEREIKINVYHHFDDDVKELATQLMKFLSNPIEIKIITSPGVATKVVLEPQTPKPN